jgi:hypothetical protein
MDTYILSIGPWLEWHVYVPLVNLIKVTYMSNWTSSQVEQKNDHIDQNDQWLLVNWDI